MTTLTPYGQIERRPGMVLTQKNQKSETLSNGREFKNENNKKMPDLDFRIIRHINIIINEAKNDTDGKSNKAHLEKVIKSASKFVNDISNRVSTANEIRHLKTLKSLIEIMTKVDNASQSEYLEDIVLDISHPEDHEKILIRAYRKPSTNTYNIVGYIFIAFFVALFIQQKFFSRNS